MGLGQSAIIKKDKTAPYDISVEYYYFGDSTDDEMNGMSVLEKLEQQGQHFRSIWKVLRI
mgnify:CR=1 FL=1